MDFPKNGEGPVLLQLHRWDSSCLPTNFLEYHEAFLSPTRELLLLLSNKSEALLLPLSSGDTYYITHGSRRYHCPENFSSSACMSESLENIASTSGSVETVYSNGCLLESNVLQSNTYPFVSNVHSIAWGLCGDVYKQPRESLFREFLFVVGNNCVTIHAFRLLDETNEVVRQPTVENESFQGRWVEWGPSYTKAPEDATTQDSASHQSSPLTSKKSLRSFLCSAKTSESDGSIWTCFPDESMFPYLATVVSFDVSFNDFLLLGLYSGDDFAMYECAHEEKPIHGEVSIKRDQTALDGFKFDGNVSVSKSYTCIKVFSSCYHHLIGFVLSSGCVTVEKGNNPSLKSQDVTVVVARLDFRGLQWLYSVRLPHMDASSESEWIDFQISDKFLISLNNFGFIFFHGAMTGEYIAHLDVVQTYGVKPEQIQVEKESLSLDVNSGSRDDPLQNKLDGARISTSQTHRTVRKQRFQRLIIAPYTSLFTVVDECGVVYVLCASDHVPDKYFLHDKLLPQYLRLGMLAPWDAGYSDISQQKLFATPSSCEKSLNSFSRSKESFIRRDLGSSVFQCVHNWHIQGMLNKDDLSLNGFSSSQKSVEKSAGSRCLRGIRKIFFPIARLGLADTICFSPLGITRLTKRSITESESCVVHASLYIESTSSEDSCLNFVNRTCDLQNDEEAIGCIFQGCLYLVTKKALSVVLPTVSMSSNSPSNDLFRGQLIKASQWNAHNSENSFMYDEPKQLGSPWQIAVLDRLILYEGPDEADFLCLENGWDLKISRLRRLELALAYLRFEEMEKSLEMLAEVNIAEEGIWKLIFAVIYMMVRGGGNDAEVSAALRILSLATCFTIKMLREYSVLEFKNQCAIHKVGGIGNSLLPLALPSKEHVEFAESRRLHEFAYSLEIIRNLQCLLAAKFKRPGQELLDDLQTQDPEDKPNLSHDDYQLSIARGDSVFAEKPNNQEPEVRELEMGFDDTEKLALVPVESLASGELVTAEMHNEMSDLLPGVVPRTKLFPQENPKEMFARWKGDHLDLKNVVRDALLSGRLPLAVLQLQLHRVKDLVDGNNQVDTFAEVRDIGREIAYELLLKGETALAVTTLQKLGEDIETCLKQLLFGTVSRLLRKQIADEVKKYGYLRSYELALLDRISLIERVYPCSSFWKSYAFQKNEVVGRLPTAEAPGEYSLCLLLPSAFRNHVIQCGDIDGVVLGSWDNANASSSEVDDDSSHAGYWAAAAVWSSAWDQKTIDRILLDQPSLLGVHVMWESQFEYHICHNDWEEVSKLLDMIPNSLLSEGSLLIRLDGLKSASSIGCSVDFLEYSSYACSPDELDAVCIDIPNIRILKSSANIACSSWLRVLVGKELAKRFIFLKEFWDGTDEIMFLLAQSGFLAGELLMASQTEYMHHSATLDYTTAEAYRAETAQAFHKLVVHHCAQYNLPYFLDIYLDHHKLDWDNDTMSSLQEASGDCQWAKWLLFSRMSGREYDASFSNARAVLVRNVVHDSSFSTLEANEIIGAVDDIAEAGWLMAALATLMFAPVPIQNCLCSGSVKRSNSSYQCTLENLSPALQKFPTLWRMLVSACLGQDTTHSLWGLKGRNALSVYINWRDSVFYSSGHDTSLHQMLPSWFPKNLRRLIQLFVQGPLGWQSMAGLAAEEAYLQRDVESLLNDPEYSEISAMSWEEAIQRQIEQELSPSVEETGLALEQQLHRGRALGAFNQLLGYRVQKLKSDGVDGRGNSGTRGQANVQSDVELLLASLTQSEESFLSSVVPLAITHYQDSVLVASSAFLLELCGLSASVLHVDVAALRRIHSFYKSNLIEQQKQLLSNGAALNSTSNDATVADSLAQAVADYYLHSENGIVKQDGAQKFVSHQQPSQPLMLVLQHLEKASIQVPSGEKTCGSWLMSGDGDGNELRSQQKAAGQRWKLVTVFFQMHQLPFSTVYLSSLARDNDWVGFLSEAQIGEYPFDLVLQVAAKEFTDQRLRTHILTVLRGMQSRKKASLSSSLDFSENRDEFLFSAQNNGKPAELFQVLAECERQKQPGKALLLKAKELSWSSLAIVASCFPDVAPLSCLTVWLEITAARETSSIKENDIASEISKNVGAAVEASNSLPTDDRVPIFHYNRKNPKRRRLMDHVSEDFSAAFSDSTSTRARVLVDTEEAGPAENVKVSNDTDNWPTSLPKLVAVLCQQHQFLPLLRAFEMFLPSCSLLPFIRALQAFSQMRLSEASAHLGSFAIRIKEEPILVSNFSREGSSGTSWISSTAVGAADAIISTCPSPYEKRCLLQLLASTEFGDEGSAAAHYRRQHWKINLAEPALRKHEDLQLGNQILDDASLLTALENNGYWEQARCWARQLEASGGPWKAAVHHVTERQAESMVTEWKEFLWDVPEERVALWRHCQNLFVRYSFPALQAGLFFLKHAEDMEKEVPPKEVHELLLLSLQWLSGMITQSSPVCPLHLLREIETQAWLLAVESEAQVKSERDSSLTRSSQDQISGSIANLVDQTADLITKMDSRINLMSDRISEKGDLSENIWHHKSSQPWEAGLSTATGSTKTKRRTKLYVSSRRPVAEVNEISTDAEKSSDLSLDFKDVLQDDNLRVNRLDASFSSWDERSGPAEFERAVLSLLEFGQVTAAKQLQQKLSSGQMPVELRIIDAALKFAGLSTPVQKQPLSLLDDNLRSLILSHNIPTEDHLIDPFQALESLADILAEGCGRGLCKRIIAVVKAANILDIPFFEAFEKQPTELLQLLSLKAQDSFEEARLLVQTHPMPETSIAKILAESFLKGLLAAHRGGYIDSQKEEGPAPLLWRFVDFLKWAELCPSAQEIGHALMRLVITGQEIPHACEVELLILSHHFYQSSACLDGVDVLVALAATRVEAYVSENDFSCLARLITGVGNFHALNFILGILIENGQLDLLLQKFSAAADANSAVAKSVRGFRMAVVTDLKHYNPSDYDAFAMVYKHFDMKHETASLLELRAEDCYHQWQLLRHKDENERLLESVRYYIEAAEVYSSIDAGNKTHSACAQASLVSLQIQMPDLHWLNLSETNARCLLANQSRFQEALIVAEAYKLNHPSEWTPVLWDQMLKPIAEEYIAEFVAVLLLQPSTLIELANLYKREIQARGDQTQTHITSWLPGGGLPEWVKQLGRSFRCLLKRTRDIRCRLQMATIATGFRDVIHSCNKTLDKVPENAGPLVLRKGHGGAYLPVM